MIFFFGWGETGLKLSACGSWQRSESEGIGSLLIIRDVVVISRWFSQVHSRFVALGRFGDWRVPSGRGIVILDRIVGLLGSIREDRWMVALSYVPKVFFDHLGRSCDMRVVFQFR